MRSSTFRLRGARLPQVVGLIPALGFAVSCAPIEVEIPAEQVVSVPGEALLGGNPLLDEQVFPSDVISEALATSLEQSFDTSGYRKEAVTSLKLTRLTLTVTRPEENGRPVRDLSFLEHLEVFAGATDDPERIRVAASEEDAFDGDPAPTTYDMPLTGLELAPKLRESERLDMSADVEPGPPPRFETDVRFDIVLTAQIDPFAVF